MNLGLRVLQIKTTWLKQMNIPRRSYSGDLAFVKRYSSFQTSEGSPEALELRRMLQLVLTRNRERDSDRAG